MHVIGACPICVCVLSSPCHACDGLYLCTGLHLTMFLAWCLVPAGDRVWASNGLGQLEVWDLRAGKLQGAIKGAGGSIRTLQLHPNQPLLASAGIDRFVRVHSSQTRQQLARVYLKQQLTGLCWLPPVPVAAAVAGDAAAAAAGGDDGMEQPEQRADDTAAVHRSASGSRRSREHKGEGVQHKSKKHKKK